MCIFRWARILSIRLENICHLRSCCTTRFWKSYRTSNNLCYSVQQMDWPECRPRLPARQPTCRIQRSSSTPRKQRCRVRGVVAFGSGRRPGRDPREAPIDDMGAPHRRKGMQHGRRPFRLINKLLRVLLSSSIRALIIWRTARGAERTTGKADWRIRPRSRERQANASSQ
jgi:hypothetical protein